MIKVIRIFFILFLVIACLGIIAFVVYLMFYVKYKPFSIELALSGLQFLISLSTLISLAVVIHNADITNRTFILTQKPSLLLQVIDEKIKDQNSNDLIHMTKIHYENNSSNPFYDLTIMTKVYTPDLTVDLSNLFKPKMYMASKDARDWRFNTAAELIKRGFDLSAAIKAGKKIKLSLEYTYSFLNKIETIHIQEYIWNEKRAGWDIE